MRISNEEKIERRSWDKDKFYFVFLIIVVENG